MRRIAVILLAAAIATACANKRLPEPLPTCKGEGVIVYESVSAPIAWAGFKQLADDTIAFYLLPKVVLLADLDKPLKGALYIRIAPEMMGWEFFVIDDFELRYYYGGATEELYTKDNLASGSIYINSALGENDYTITLTNIATTDGKHISATWNGMLGELN